MTTMQLARIHGPNDVRLDEVAVPEPGPNDVVVRVEACGICGSDLGYIATGGTGAPVSEPMPIGHEFSGIVERVGKEIGSSIYPVPAHVPAALAALAEPLSVALHGINLVDVTPDDKVAVIGAGPIGLCAVAMLRHRGVKNIAIIDRVDDRSLGAGAWRG